MASFFHLVRTFDYPSFQDDDDGKLDIISVLPVEIATDIFRMLDPASMLAAMQVSKTWYHLYQSDNHLKRTLKSKMKHQRLTRKFAIYNLTVKPSDSWYRRPPAVIRDDFRVKKRRGTAKKKRSGRKVERLQSFRGIRI